MSFYTDKTQVIQQSCTEWSCIYKNFTVPFEKSETVSFASSKRKYIQMFPALSKVAVKLICWHTLGSASSACCLLNLQQLFCNDF